MTPLITFQSPTVHDLGGGKLVFDLTPEAQGAVLDFEYTNYRGETAWRKALPLRIAFGATEHHPKPQWILEAFDMEKGAERSFALLDVRQWSPTSQPIADEITQLTTRATAAERQVLILTLALAKACEALTEQWPRMLPGQIVTDFMAQARAEVMG